MVSLAPNLIQILMNIKIVTGVPLVIKILIWIDLNKRLNICDQRNQDWIWGALHQITSCLCHWLTS